MATVAELIDRVSKLTCVPCRPASESDLEWLIERDFPDKIVDFYRHHEPESTIEYGPEIRPIIELEDRDSGDPVAFAAWKIGLLPFGGDPCGDTLCFDPAHLNAEGWPRVVSVSHETVSETSTEEEIRDGVGDYCEDLPALLQQMLDAEEARKASAGAGWANQDPSPSDRVKHTRTRRTGRQCPQCKMDVEDKGLVVCPHCGSSLDKGSDDWVVKRVIQLVMVILTLSAIGGLIRFLLPLLGS